VLCGFDTRYNPRMASAPERHDVLRRLGVIKSGGEDAFARPLKSRAAFEDESVDDVLESFRQENASSSLVKQVLPAAASRTAILVVISVFVVAVFGALVMFSVGTSEAPDAETSAATSTEVTPTIAQPPSIQTAAAKTPIHTPSPIVAPARPRVLANPSDDVSPATTNAPPDPPDTHQPLSSDLIGSALPSSTAAVADVIDQTLYSKDDADVQPPRLLSPELPVAAISGWTTRTNVIEVIVSESGSVERARFVATPQRMPDMFVLNRAKVWKFFPATKDGRPVRYRLLVTWEVNP